jgi:hypothetical protein
MTSTNRSLSKRADYWQPAALKPKILLTEDGYPHHELDERRTSGQEVFEMSPFSSHTVIIGGPEKSSDSQAIVYPGKVKLGFITLALCLAVFLVALDQTIIATAVPKITDEFKALDDVGWYGSVYMFTLCAFQLLYGKFYTYFSLKWTYLGAIGKILHHQDHRSVFTQISSFVRDRFSHLWCCTKLINVDPWPRNCRTGMQWHIFRISHHPYTFRTTTTCTHLHWHCRCQLRYRCRGWATARWHLY